MKRKIIDEGHALEEAYPFKIKPNFSALGSIIQEEPGWQFNFMLVNQMPHVVGTYPVKKYDEYNLSPNPVDKLSVNITFFETDMAQEMILEANGQEISMFFGNGCRSWL